MGIIADIVELTKNVYGIDVSKSVYLTPNGNQLVLLGGNNFDWYIEGVIINDPSFDANENVQYVLSGISNVYVNNNSSVKLYVRKDYDSIIKKYFKNYCLVDIDDNGPVDYVFNRGSC